MIEGNEEWLIGKDLEQSGCGSIEVLPWGTEENHEKPASVTSVLAHI
jgi:hypothetical protein